MGERPVADLPGTVATYTVDRLAYSPVAADDRTRSSTSTAAGGTPVEVADADADEIGVGRRVEMTFRRLYTAGGVHNYFWKARRHRETMASNGQSARQGRDRRDGLHAVRRALGQSADDLLVDAVAECMDVAPGARPRRHRRLLARHHGLGQSGLTLSRPLRIDDKPVTRVENYCATGSEAFRNACYAVASGAYDW